MMGVQENQLPSYLIKCLDKERYGAFGTNLYNNIITDIAAKYLV